MKISSNHSYHNVHDNIKISLSYKIIIMIAEKQVSRDIKSHYQIIMRKAWESITQNKKP